VGGACFVDEIGFAFGWIVEPDHVLVGHGEGIHGDAAAALREAVSFARRRTPCWAGAVLRAHGRFHRPAR
jgi:hypothetical protein